MHKRSLYSRILALLLSAGLLFPSQGSALRPMADTPGLGVQLTSDQQAGQEEPEEALKRMIAEMKETTPFVSQTFNDLVEEMRWLLFQFSTGQVMGALQRFRDAWARKENPELSFEVQSQQALLDRIRSPETSATASAYLQSLPQLSSAGALSAPLVSVEPSFPQPEVRTQSVLPRNSAIVSSGADATLSYAILSRAWEVTYVSDQSTDALVHWPLLGLLFAAADNRVEWLSLLLGTPLAPKEIRRLRELKVSQIRSALVQKRADAKFQVQVIEALTDQLAPQLSAYATREHIRQIVEAFLQHARETVLSDDRSPNTLAHQFWSRAIYLQNGFAYHWAASYWRTQRVSGAVVEPAQSVTWVPVFEQVRDHNLQLSAVHVGSMRGTDLSGEAASAWGLSDTINHAAFQILGYTPGGILVPRPRTEPGANEMADTTLVIPQTLERSREGYGTTILQLPGVELDVAVSTHQGSRLSQKDNWIVEVIEQDGQPFGVLVIVADGYEAHGAGGSLYASEGILGDFIANEEVAELDFLSGPLGPDEIETLRGAGIGIIHGAHRDLVDLAKFNAGEQEEPSWEKTTVAVLLITPHQDFSWNVGDTRSYAVRQKQLQLLTRDHSLNWHLAEEKLTDPPESLLAMARLAAQESHDTRNIITNGLGSGDQAASNIGVYFSAGNLSVGDSYLTVTDGIWDDAAESDLVEAMAESQSAFHGKWRLIRKIGLRGDNKTGVLVKTRKPVLTTKIVGLEEFSQVLEGPTARLAFPATGVASTDLSMQDLRPTFGAGDIFLVTSAAYGGGHEQKLNYLLRVDRQTQTFSVLSGEYFEVLHDSSSQHEVRVDPTAWVYAEQFPRNVQAQRLFDRLDVEVWVEGSQLTFDWPDLTTKSEGIYVFRHAPGQEESEVGLEEPVRELSTSAVMQSVFASPDGRWLVGVHDDAPLGVSIWDRQDASEPSSIDVNVSGAEGRISFSQANPYVLLGTSEGSQWIHLEESRAEASLEHDFAQLLPTPQGSYALAFVDGNGRLQLSDLEGKSVTTKKSSPVLSLQKPEFALSDAWLAIVPANGNDIVLYPTAKYANVKFWDDKAIIRRTHDKPVQGLKFIQNASGQNLLASWSENEVKLWRLSTQKSIFKWTLPDGHTFESVDVNPAGTELAAIVDRDEVRVLSVKDAALIRRYPQPTGASIRGLHWQDDETLAWLSDYQVHLRETQHHLVLPPLYGGMQQQVGLPRQAGQSTSLQFEDLSGHIDRHQPNRIILTQGVGNQTDMRTFEVRDIAAAQTGVQVYLNAQNPGGAVHHYEVRVVTARADAAAEKIMIISPVIQNFGLEESEVVSAQVEPGLEDVPEALQYGGVRLLTPLFQKTPDDSGLSTLEAAVQQLWSLPDRSLLDALQRLRTVSTVEQRLSALRHWSNVLNEQVFMPRGYAVILDIDLVPGGGRLRAIPVRLARRNAVEWHTLDGETFPIVMARDPVHIGVSTHVLGASALTGVVISPKGIVRELDGMFSVWRDATIAAAVAKRFSFGSLDRPRITEVASAAVHDEEVRHFQGIVRAKARLLERVIDGTPTTMRDILPDLGVRASSALGQKLIGHFGPETVLEADDIGRAFSYVQEFVAALERLRQGGDRTTMGTLETVGFDPQAIPLMLRKAVHLGPATYVRHFAVQEAVYRVYQVSGLTLDEFLQALDAPPAAVFQGWAETVWEQVLEPGLFAWELELGVRPDPTLDALDHVLTAGPIALPTDGGIIGVFDPIEVVRSRLFAQSAATLQGGVLDAAFDAALSAGHTSVRLVPLSAVAPQHPIHVYAQPVWRSQLEVGLEQAVEQGHVVFVDAREEAHVSIGDWLLPAMAGQALLQIDAQTVYHITPAFLYQLDNEDLLLPGTTLVIGLLVTGDFGEALLVFA